MLVLLEKSLAANALRSSLPVVYQAISASIFLNCLVAGVTIATK